MLDACGSNIDSAIKQLGQLRLTAHCGTVQPAASAVDAAANPSAPGTGQTAGDHWHSSSCAVCAHLPCAWKSHSSVCLRRSAFEPHIKAVSCLSSTGPSASVSSSVQAAAQPGAEAKAKSPEEWVETLVQQMASARDMADARSRAASVLQTFQQAVLHTSAPQASYFPCHALASFTPCRLCLCLT